MRIKVLAFATALLFIVNSSAGTPQSASSATNSPQAATILAQSAKALSGSGVLNDVTLTGTVEWIAGSEDESGTAVFKSAGGAHRLDLTFRNGTRRTLRFLGCGLSLVFAVEFAGLVAQERALFGHQHQNLEFSNSKH